MCGGGGDQTVTQKTELDPVLRRHLYGGTLAAPGGGYGDEDDAASPPENPYGGDGGGFAGDGDAGGGFAPSPPGAPGSGVVYANGGVVQGYNMGGQVQQQGLAALNQGQMPMMGGQMPNLSDPMTAATLAMAVRRPEMQYGQVMANQMANQMADQMTNPMANPMANQMTNPMANPRQGFNMGGYVEGPGTGRSDDIEAQIYQNGMPVQEARLSDGEFVMTERAVRGAGDGDPEEGAAKMYRMMQEFERGGYV